jgi:hypothetical protein
MKQATTFHFETASFNPEKRVFFFTYSVDFTDSPSMQFQEIIQLPQVETINELPAPLMNHLTVNLHLMIGISYWKIYAPKTIDLGTIKLSQKQAEFWNTIYTIGLGKNVNQTFLRDTIAGSPDNYFFSATSKQLADAYRKVAQDVCPEKIYLTRILERTKNEMERSE